MPLFIPHAASVAALQLQTNNTKVTQTRDRRSRYLIDQGIAIIHS